MKGLSRPTRWTWDLEEFLDENEEM